MLAQHQDDRKSGGHEREHNAQVHPSAERVGAHRYRVDRGGPRSSVRRNGNLLFTLQPIQEVLNDHYSHQLEQLELVAERQRIAKLIQEQEIPSATACELLCALFAGGAECPSVPPGGFGRIQPVFWGARYEKGAG